MSSTWPGRLVVFFAFLLMAAPVSAEVVRLEQQGGAVAGVDAAGETLWTIEYASEKPLRFEPLIDGRRGYLARRSDLLTVDLDAGQIVERHRFPGVIDAMAPAEDGYTLTVFSRALTVEEPEAESTIEVHYRPGDPTPGSGLFESALIMTASADALALAGVEQEIELEMLSLEQAEQAIARLSVAEERDPTNLFLPLYRGRVTQLSQEDASPAKLYERAVQIEDAPWSDDLLATFLLIKYGEDALSKKVAARAKQKMQDRGLLVERFNGLAMQTELSLALRELLRDGIHGNDVELVDNLQGRIAEFFPNSEQSALTWRWVGDWIGAKKRAELAQAWRGRAAKASHAPLVALNEASARKADRASLLWMALVMTLILIPLGVGLRATRRRTAKGLPLPDINMWDAIGLFALVLGCSILPAVVQKHATVSATLKSAPPELFDATYDSPKVLTWLEELGESESRDVWIAYARKAQDALRAGARASDAPPSEQLLAEAISVGPGANSDISPASLSGAARVGALAQISRVVLAILAIVCGLLMMLLGVLIRRKAPRVAENIRIFIPGGAKVLSPLAVIICGLFSAAFLALLFEMDRGVRTVVLPRSGAIFEQGELVDTYLTLPSTWIALAAALLTLHGVTIWLERNEGKLD